jgi:eukaryotic-like serine/threonine-protein kinase
MSTLLYTNIGDYHIVDLLGVGGMGEVYRARHTKLNRVVAIKFISISGEDNSFQERFLNEARVLSKLQHKNIVTLYDFTTHQDKPCIIMEFVQGNTLLQHIKNNGPMSPSEAQLLFEAIVDAITHIHDNGIIHRDIKSNNIMINSSKEIKLLDFGIAKTNQGTRITQIEQVIGTDQYLAPEILSGREANFSTDIWSLGVLLYEMVTGILPFEDTDRIKLYEKIKNSVYQPPSKVCLSVTPQIETIISKCLKKKPKDRYQSAKELLRDIKAVTNSSIKRITNSSDLEKIYDNSFISNKPINNNSRNAFIFSMIAIISLTIGLGFYFIWSEPVVKEPAKPNNQQIPKLQSVQNIALRVDVYEGKAEVYDLKDQYLGATPYTYKAYVGEKVELILRQNGYVDQPVSYPISNSIPMPCTIHMQRKKER